MGGSRRPDARRDGALGARAARGRCLLTRADRLAVLVHELRSPVAALRAIADAAAGGALAGAHGRRLVLLAVEAVRSVDRLVADPALVSLRPAAVDLAEIAESTVAARRLAGQPVVLEVEGGDLGAVVDPVRVRQALDNLVANAVSHSPAGAAVRVVVRDRGREVEIRVADDGDGIDARDQARVFEVGVRLTAARPGSGLGLAIVRAVAAAHGGRVELESAPGAGSTFTLVLPRGDGPSG